MNVFRSQAGVLINIIAPATIFGNSTSDLYSFSNTSDVRFLNLSSITTSLYNDYIALYSEFRIVSASLIVAPVPGTTLDRPGMLYVTFDPDAAGSANPNNLVVTSTENAHLFAPTAVVPSDITYTFPGVGVGTNIWQSTTTAPAGTFFLGCNLLSSTFTATAIVFDASVSFRVQFRAPKTH